MINFTPLFRNHLVGRLQQHARYIDYADAVQQGELVRLPQKASLTRIGRKNSMKLSHARGATQDGWSWWRDLTECGPL